MIVNVKPGKRTGSLVVPESKSYAHRMLIGAALSNRHSQIRCARLSEDIEATIACLRTLGANICVNDRIIEVAGVFCKDDAHSCEIEKRKTQNGNEALDEALAIDNEALGETLEGDTLMLHCNESGSTLRFLIPVVGALGTKASFVMEGKLSERPLDALCNELTKHGMTFLKEGKILNCQGKLTPGNYVIPGNISSQFISGLLFALPLLSGDSTLTVTGNTESRGYVEMTKEVIKDMGICIEAGENVYKISGNQTYCPKAMSAVEKDWSNAAFYLCMGAMSKKGITLEEMNVNSLQSDRAILDVLKKFGADVEISGDKVTVRQNKLNACVIDAKEIPDLVPTVSALAAISNGKTKIINAARLRMKESDRLFSTANMLNSLGALVTELEDSLEIEGKPYLDGGTIDAMCDHRIAMSAAVAACGCRNEVTVNGADCVAKSYPEFWKDFDKLEVEDE